MPLTRTQSREIDRIAVERFAMPSIVLMENASRALADAVMEFPGAVLVVCGGGNNGGDGLAAARHLHNRHRDVTIALTLDPALYRGDALINYQIVRAMNLPIVQASPQIIAQGDWDVIVDAIFGTGLSQPPRPGFSELAFAINASPAKVVATDLPSGIDCDTGLPLGPVAVRADVTVTFVDEKVGFANAAQYVGQVRIADIGCPREILDLVR